MMICRVSRHNTMQKLVFGRIRVHTGGVNIFSMQMTSSSNLSLISADGGLPFFRMISYLATDTIAIFLSNLQRRSTAIIYHRRQPGMSSPAR